MKGAIKVTDISTGIYQKVYKISTQKSDVLLHLIPLDEAAGTCRSRVRDNITEYYNNLRRHLRVPSAINIPDSSTEQVSSPLIMFTSFDGEPLNKILEDSDAAGFKYFARKYLNLVADFKSKKVGMFSDISQFVVNERKEIVYIDLFPPYTLPYVRQLEKHKAEIAYLKHFIPSIRLEQSVLSVYNNFKGRFGCLRSLVSPSIRDAVGRISSDEWRWLEENKENLLSKYGRSWLAFTGRSIKCAAEYPSEFASSEASHYVYLPRLELWHAKELKSALDDFHRVFSSSDS